MPFLTGHNMFILRLLFPLMRVMALRAAKPTIRSGSQKFLSAVIAYFAIKHPASFAYDIQGRIILFYQLYLPLVLSSSPVFEVAALATELCGISLGLELFPTPFTRFFETHLTNKTNH